ncbi:SUMF1/EgtB/PvdO family nonheme iron enzyme [Pseudactinotalea sp. HY158]|nr:SUMF1/EgtB/PvdO family nonheme iron enzyme [Pseudactinotalea sp. HY158]
MNHDAPAACCAPGRPGDRPGGPGGTVGPGGSVGTVASVGPVETVTPVRGAGGVVHARERRPAGVPDPVHLPGGTFRMGGNDLDANPLDGEGPIREATLSPFAIGATTVTNSEFAAFVEQTGYVTEAEDLGWSFTFVAFLPGHLRRREMRVAQAPWWSAVPRAAWNRPEGPDSDVSDRGDHPVVHVSWRDAETYAAWAGGRLPSEAEWEYAARGGLVGARYPWGDDLTPGGEHRCNIWQGTFPTKNTAADGYRGTAPARSFPPNGYGLYNVAGNVWEMCADRWRVRHPAGPVTDPLVASDGGDGMLRVMRGGSYLCHDSYCNRYRVAARTQNSADSASGNQGFRIAFDA